MMPESLSESRRGENRDASVPLKLIFISNYFPPETRGGYELYCYEVAKALVGRGHQITVLTSHSRGPRTNDLVEGINICRLLHLEVEAGTIHTSLRYIRDRKRLEKEDREHVARVIEMVHPEAALVWGMWNVPKTVPAMVERLMAKCTAYYFCDYWPTLPSAYQQQLRTPANRALAVWPKKVLAQAIEASLPAENGADLAFLNPIVVSRAVSDHLMAQGIHLDTPKVIYGGVKAQVFFAAASDRSRIPHKEGLRLLYLGRVHPDKGVHTIIEAIKILAGGPGPNAVTLDIVGHGDRPYVAQLYEAGEAMVASGQVRFHDPVDHRQIPELLGRFDALVLPSIWEEPFARVVLEGMASGLVVIGSDAGGTKEILVDGDNGLLFPAGDAVALAERIELLLRDTSLRIRMSRAAQVRVSEGFTLEQMADSLERVLSDVARGNGRR